MGWARGGWRAPVWTLLLLALSGCGAGCGLRTRGGTGGSGEPAIEPPPEGLERRLEELTTARFVPGNRVSLAEDGAVFDEMVEMIGEARESVHIVLYIWRESPPSERILEALRERRPGVARRVLVDAAGAKDFDKVIEPKLEAMGCEGISFSGLLDEETRLVEHNHRKIVVVDGRLGLTGGWGIWKSWTGDGLAPDDWRETNIRVDGPVVRQLQRAFDESWRLAGGEPLPQNAYPIPEPFEDGSRAGFVASSEEQEARTGETDARELMVTLFQVATERLWIANAYFVPDEGLLTLLEEKARRGVDVRVLAPGPHHDWKKSIRAAQRGTYPRLLEAGVRLYEYQPSMMHSKIAIVDDRYAMVGSINLEPLSLHQLQEGALVVEDEALVAEMAQRFEEDLEHSEEILEAEKGFWNGLARGVMELIGAI